MKTIIGRQYYVTIGGKRYKEALSIYGDLNDAEETKERIKNNPELHEKDIQIVKVLNPHNTKEFIYWLYRPV